MTEIEELKKKIAELQAENIKLKNDLKEERYHNVQLRAVIRSMSRQ